ncbi:MAG: hypothetical protein J5523_00025 [Muribaculaceae bacterium]|nr:hypothetical protein [Muribaculaceae bacterium]
MKRFILLIATIVSVAIAVHAVNYDLWINGIQVTSSNASNLSVISGVSGTVTYNASTKTLTLNNAAMTIADAENIKNGINGLTIQVVGTNTLNVTASGHISLQVDESLTIAGTGTLNCSATSTACFISAEKTLTIQGGVQANFSGWYGIYGDWQHLSHLVVNGANTRVTAYGGDISIFSVETELNDDLAITSPSGVYIDADGSAVYSDGSYVREQVVISKRNPGAPIYYNLWINNVQINSENASNISVIADTGSQNGHGCSISGTVTYNANTKTLTLNNAYLDGVSLPSNIKSRIDGLTINVEGRNTIISSSESLNLDKSVTIKGSGVLHCKGTYKGCQLQDDATLTVRDGVQVKFYGLNYGVHALSSTARMVVSGSSTKVTASGSISCICQTPTTLNNGLALTLPQGAHFDSNGTVMDASGDTIKV